MTRPGMLVVVETERDHYLGTVEHDGTQVVIRTHRAGRPIRVERSEVIEVRPARNHPLVEGW